MNEKHTLQLSVSDFALPIPNSPATLATTESTPH
jgi:hypothetical protein